MPVSSRDTKERFSAALLGSVHSWRGCRRLAEEAGCLLVFQTESNAAQPIKGPFESVCRPPPPSSFWFN